MSEEQRRPFLKQAGVIPSVSGTASVANKLSRIAVNCQAGSADRKDRLQAEIIKILTENIGMTWRQVARELDKTPWLGCQGDIYKWVETDGREGGREGGDGTLQRDKGSRIQGQGAHFVKVSNLQPIVKNSLLRFALAG